MNRLVRSIRAAAAWALLTGTLLVSGVATASASIAITLDSPHLFPSSVVGHSLSLSVSVNSTFDVASVIASVESVSTALVPRDGWTGSLFIKELPRGPANLVIVATDVYGASATQTYPFVHDNPPVITVVSPTRWTVASPFLALNATCTDDGPSGCTSFRVLARRTDLSDGERVLAVGTNSKIDTTISLAQYADLDPYINGAIRFHAYDDNWTATVILVETPIDATETNTAVNTVDGLILDATEDRLLYHRNDGKVVLRTRTNGGESVLGDAASVSYYPIVSGWLTSRGAAWLHHPSNECNGNQGFEYHDGVTTQFFVSTCDPEHTTFQVAGDYAYWTGKLRNIAIGTEVNVNWDETISQTLVAPNGTLFGIAKRLEPTNIYRFRNGTITRFGPNNGVDDPATDGETLVYYTPAAGGHVAAQLDANGNESAIVPDIATAWYTPRVAGGWRTFMRPSQTSGILQIWTKSPTGAESQVTATGSDPIAETLYADGAVAFTVAAKRYLAQAGAAPKLAGGSVGLGTSLKRFGSEWYVGLGNTLFHCFQPPARTPDGGVGTSDAGQDAAANDGGDAAGGPGATDAGTFTDGSVHDADSDASIPPTDAAADTSMGAFMDANVDAAGEFDGALAMMDAASWDSGVADSGGVENVADSEIKEPSAEASEVALGATSEEDGAVGAEDQENDRQDDSGCQVSRVGGQTRDSTFWWIGLAAMVLMQRRKLKRARFSDQRIIVRPHS